jgi:hypothetical protein
MLHKDGNMPEECEDAIDDRMGPDRAALTIAIADGASSTAFSGRWARLLAEHAVTHPRRSAWTRTWIESPAKMLRAGINIASLPWHLQDKAGRGAFAALHSVHFDLKSAVYFSRAIGDVCLVVVSRGSRVQILPERFEEPDRFAERPFLIGSNPAANEVALSRQTGRERVIPRGESTFFCMSDALARWFIQSCRGGSESWRELADLTRKSEFDDFVAGERACGSLLNDDVSLIRVKLMRG